MSFLKNTLGYLSGIKLLSKQFKYAKDDISSFKNNLNVSKEQFKTRQIVGDWNTVVIENNVTAQMLLTQYKKRQFVAYILILTFLFSLYFLIFDDRFSSGLAGCLVSFVVYTKNALRLYQIRERNLCSWKEYCVSVKASFKEFFPVALPANWKLMQLVKQVKPIKINRRHRK